MAELLPINTGRQQCSFTKIKIEIPAGGSYKYDSPFNYFRCYDATDDFHVSWSTNSSRTDFGAGFGVRFEDVIPYVIIFNPNKTPLLLSVGVGIGYFDDSRLTVSGTVQTSPAQYNNLSVETLNFDSSGQITIPPAQRVLIQNTGSAVVYIGGTGTDGLQLQPQGTFETSLQDSLTLYGTSGSTVAVGSFS